MTRRPFSLMGLLAIATLWVGALVAAPSAATQSTNPLATSLSAAVYLAGSNVCHQRAERSFHIHGVRMPVCARCTGLYFGGALGVLAWGVMAGVRAHAPRRAKELATSFALPRTILIIAAVPTILTVITATLGVWDPGNMTRAVLALPLGLAIGSVVSAAAAGDLR